jgi:hypothetical protein
MKKNIVIGAAIFFFLAVMAALAVYGYKVVFCEEIRGRVMVVQRNAEVKRLALIKVYAISSSNAEKWKHSVVEKCRRIMDESIVFRKKSSDLRMRIVAENDSSIVRLNALLDAAVASRDAAREFWIVNPNQPAKKRRFFEAMVIEGFPSAKTIEEYALSSKWDKCYEALRKEVVPELEEKLAKAESRKVSELKQHDNEVSEKIKEFGVAYARELSFESLTEIPIDIRVTAEGISDDNGDFSLGLPVGDYYLIARGSRRVFDSDEHYYWARRVSVPSDDSKRCLMGNNNMMNGPESNMWTDLATLIKSQKELK